MVGSEEKLIQIMQVFLHAYSVLAMAIIARAVRDWEQFGSRRQRHSYLLGVHKYRFDQECRECKGENRDDCERGACDYERHKYTNQELEAFFHSEWARTVFKLADIDMMSVMSRLGIAFTWDKIA